MIFCKSCGGAGEMEVVGQVEDTLVLEPCESCRGSGRYVERRPNISRIVAHQAMEAAVKSLEDEQVRLRRRFPDGSDF